MQIALRCAPFTLRCYMPLSGRSVFVLAMLSLASAMRASAALGQSSDSTRAAAPIVARSPHHTRFIKANGARLHVLDWGGTGPLLLLLPGFNTGAHIFDDMAPAFRDRYHVVSFTPRGFPPSSAPDSGYSITQLADDVRAVLDSLGAKRAILAGHSISGAVITRFAERYPARLLAAVYLDAAFDFGAAYRASRSNPVKFSPASVDTTTPHFRAWERRYDTPSPAYDADVQSWNLDSAEVARRHALTSQLATEVRAHSQDFRHVFAPALAICAQGSVDRWSGWLTPDSTRWQQAKQLAAQSAQRQRRECEDFRRMAPHGESLVLPSGHFVFVDRQDVVTTAMRRFLARAVPSRQHRAP